jgi:hypothetical protein
MFVTLSGRGLGRFNTVSHCDLDTSRKLNLYS